jgi:hypothetical protein
MALIVTGVVYTVSYAEYRVEGFDLFTVVDWEVDAWNAVADHFADLDYASGVYLIQAWELGNDICLLEILLECNDNKTLEIA